jgi:hypothetical protein
MKKILEFLEGQKGEKSSKRLGGAFCLSLGGLMKFILFIYSLFLKPAVDFISLDHSTDYLIAAGAGLLGIGLVELFSKKKK